MDFVRDKPINSSSHFEHKRLTSQTRKRNGQKEAAQVSIRTMLSGI